MKVELFSLWPSLLGGALIGLSAALLLAYTGRIAGIAGILGNAWVVLRRGGPTRWRGQGLRWAFLLGLVAAPWVWRCLAPWPAVVIEAGPMRLAVAGLLVGVGVRLGSGCTSGHGVCGLSRGSVRSMANVAAFMGAGFATVAMCRHVLP